MKPWLECLGSLAPVFKLVTRSDQNILLKCCGKPNPPSFRHRTKTPLPIHASRLAIAVKTRKEVLFFVLPVLRLGVG